VILQVKKEALVRPLLLILSVIQNAKTRAFARLVLEGAGHRVIEAAGSSQAIALLSNGLDPDLLLCEVSPANASETSQFHQYLKFASAEKICLITRLSDQQILAEAAELGILRTLTMPLMREDIELAVESLTLASRHVCAVRNVSSDFSEFAISAADLAHSPHIPEDMPAVPYLEDLEGSNFFLAASPQMLEIHRQVKLIADIDVNVLILGDSGTGKEVIAQLIHKHSRRSREKLLKVNCAALPADLLESELFGHRQGAFTGAINDRAGKFDQANRGTLLLDEIGEIGVQMQAKLLHVLQDGQFSRLGAQETTKVR
jgi:transcriptional regulator with GAF, ATPase, and Fis domain